MKSRLTLSISLCDGGEYSSGYSAKNMLISDTSVYSSQKAGNINCIFELDKEGTPMEFWISEFTVIAPGSGFTAPVGTGLFWVFDQAPDLKSLHIYENFDSGKFQAIPSGTKNAPLVFFDMGSLMYRSFRLPTPVKGKYVVVKFISRQSGSSGDNIDVQEIFFNGMTQDTSSILNLVPLDPTLTVFHDVTFEVGSENFQGHKLVWSQCSKLDLSKPSVKLSISTPMFKLIEKYLYTGLIDITAKNFQDLIDTAEKFGIESLSLSCFDYLVKTQCTDENVCTLLQETKSGKYGQIDLRQVSARCMNYIARHGEDVLKSASFLSIDEEILTLLLKSDKLGAYECTVFDAVYNWGKKRATDGKVSETLVNVLPLVRFPLIMAEDLILKVKPTKLCPPKTYLEAIEYQMAPELVKKNSILYKPRLSVWKFIFTPPKTNTSLFSITNGTNVKKIGGGSTWANAMCYGSVGMSKAIFYYEYTIKALNSDKSGFALGLTTSIITPIQYSHDMVIGMSGYQYKMVGTGASFQTGDIVGVHLDFTKNKLCYFKNGIQIPNLSGTLVTGTTYYPVVHLYYVNDEISVSFPTIKPNPK